MRPLLLLFFEFCVYWNEEKWVLLSICTIDTAFRVGRQKSETPFAFFELCMYWNEEKWVLREKKKKSWWPSWVERGSH